MIALAEVQLGSDFLRKPLRGKCDRNICPRITPPVGRTYRQLACSPPNAMVRTDSQACALALCPLVTLSRRRPGQAARALLDSRLVRIVKSAQNSSKLGRNAA